MKSLNCLLKFLLTFPLIYHLVGAQTDDINRELSDTFYTRGIDARIGRVYDSAVYYHRQSLAIDRELGYIPGQGKNYYQMGRVEESRGNYQTALIYFDSARLILEGQLEGDFHFWGDLYHGLGRNYINSGLRYKAKIFLEKTAEYYEQAGIDKPSTWGTLHYNLGLVNWYFGEATASLHHYLSCYPIYQELYGDQSTALAQLFNNIGLVYFDNGDFEHAREYFERSKTIHVANHGNDHWNLGFSIGNLGRVHNALGNQTAALNHFLDALRLSQKYPDYLRSLESVLLNAIAEIYLDQDDLNKSLNYSHQAIEVTSDLFYETHPQLSDFYKNIAHVFTKQGKRTLADSFYHKAIDVIEVSYGTQHPKLAQIYLDQALFIDDYGDHSLALEKVEAGLAALLSPQSVIRQDENPDVDSVLDKRKLFGLLMAKSKILHHRSEGENTKDLHASLGNLKHASQVIDKVRRGYLSESSKLFLQQNMTDFFDLALDVVYDLYRQTDDPKYFDEALYFLEKSKSAVLSDALHSSLHTPIRGIPAELLETERNLDLQVKSLQLKLNEAQLSDGQEKIDQMKRDLFYARASLDSLAAVIQDLYPNYYDLRYNHQVVSIDEVIQQSNKKTLILSISEGKNEWYVLSILGQKTKFEKVSKEKLPSESLRTALEMVRDPQSDLEKYLDLSYEIYQKLIFQHISEEIEQVIISPSGSLHYFPFEALQVMAPRQGPHYFVEKAPVSYAINFTLFIKYGTDTELPERSYMGFAPAYSGSGPDLPDEFREDFSTLSGTKDEVSHAAAIFGGEAYLDSNATESQFKSLKSGSAIVHLAMHALANDENPMHSRLIFSSGHDSIEDGFLNAYEIYNLEIPSQLIVLSACNTGYGKISEGEGVMSLSRAFMYAGCNSILMSLWSARDKPTQEIVTDFFEKIKKGYDKDEALQQAKRSFLQLADPIQRHPAMWATLVLSGNCDSIRFKSHSTFYYISVAIILLITLIYIRTRTR